MQKLNDNFMQMGIEGISILLASGDNGSFFVSLPFIFCVMNNNGVFHSFADIFCLFQVLVVTMIVALSNLIFHLHPTLQWLGRQSSTRRLELKLVPLCLLVVFLPIISVPLIKRVSVFPSFLLSLSLFFFFFASFSFFFSLHRIFKKEKKQ